MLADEGEEGDTGKPLSQDDIRTRQEVFIGMRAACRLALRLSARSTTLVAYYAQDPARNPGTLLQQAALNAEDNPADSRFAMIKAMLVKGANPEANVTEHSQSALCRITRLGNQSSRDCMQALIKRCENTEIPVPKLKSSRKGDGIELSGPQPKFWDANDWG